MKRRKTTRKDKLQYWFDNLMAKGTISMVGILFVITVVVVVLAGILAVLLGCVDADIFGSIWISLMHAVDAGTLAGDAGSLPFMPGNSVRTFYHKCTDRYYQCRYGSEDGGTQERKILRSGGRAYCDSGL